MASNAPPTSAFAESTQTASLSARRNPLVLWHLLSLDAPTVAALWVWFVARQSHILLPVSSVLAMAIAVWMLYAADRLLDTRTTRAFQELEERHYFHRNHRRAFSCGLVLAALVLAVLLPRIGASSLILYAVLGALLSAYFVLIHASADAGRGQRLPKELAVGVFFSAAIFIPTVSRAPQLRLALVPAAVLFAILCSLNCLFIYAWEHSALPVSTHPATRVASHFLRPIAVAAVITGIILALLDPLLPWQTPAACATSSTLLLLLHRNRQRFDPLALRTAADLCLLTPLVFLVR